MDIVKFANSFQSTSVLKLDGIRRLLEQLGNPQKNLKYVHVAGTNGKGSVCAFLQGAFTAAGLKCGKFTTPYMVVPEEKISIDGKPIPEASLQKLFKEIEPFVDGQSPFELWTAAAFCYFKQEKCDIVVLECGMGGLGDATNIIPPPICAILTRIGLDHTEYLGDSIEEITRNKCGIIKPGTQHTVTIRQSTAPLIESLSCGKFHLAEPITDMPLGLSGAHQAENAGIAAEVCRAMHIPESAIAYGLSHAVHPGRFEVFPTNPVIIFDGAHNPNGAEALCTSLPEGNLTLICAFMADKDIAGILNIFKKHGVHKRARMLCTTVPDNPRAETPEHLTSLARACGFRAESCLTVFDALKQAKATTLVFGSLYLYKPFHEAMTAIFPAEKI